VAQVPLGAEFISSHSAISLGKKNWNGTEVGRGWLGQANLDTNSVIPLYCIFSAEETLRVGRLPGRLTGGAGSKTMAIYWGVDWMCRTD
jgi:hypothetical protein